MGSIFLDGQEFEKFQSENGLQLWRSVCPDCGKGFKFWHPEGTFPKNPQRRCRAHEVKGKPLAMMPREEAVPWLVSWDEFMRMPTQFAKSVEYPL
ncbi:MAG: hypothetical protein HQL93_13165 [Magnetococcales bacterium]|nr:hypothetical protein [Magnetococcales bacterium]